eukprot:gene3410-2361_t
MSKLDAHTLWTLSLRPTIHNLQPSLKHCQIIPAGKPKFIKLVPAVHSPAKSSSHPPDQHHVQAHQNTRILNHERANHHNSRQHSTTNSKQTQTLAILNHKPLQTSPRYRLNYTPTAQVTYQTRQATSCSLNFAQALKPEIESHQQNTMPNKRLKSKPHQTTTCKTKVYTNSTNINVKVNPKKPKIIYAKHALIRRKHLPKAINIHTIAPGRKGGNPTTHA